MSDDNTPGSGEKAKPTQTGAAQTTLTAEQITEIASKAAAAAVAGVSGTIETLSKTVNGLAADKRRGKEKPAAKDDEKDDSNPSTTEVDTLRDEVTKLREERAADRKRLALKDALDELGDTIVGRKYLEKLITADLEIDSTGNVVAKVDGKHVGLKDHIATFAKDPQWQKPTGTDGTGKPASGARSGDAKKIQLKRNDFEGKVRYREQILKGEVEFVD